MTSSMWRGARLLASAMALATTPAAAQYGQQPTPPYGVQQAPPAPDPAADLRRNLATVGSDPTNVTALVDSGRAALAMGDPQAALTFFSRADEISPRDARVKAGMASAMTMLGQPRPALTLFAEAQGLGAPEIEIASDRGLAHDLLGDPRAAQRDYALVMRRRDNDETRRRLALSLAISGQREPALRLLEPQTRRNDRAGWRTQAFVLALTGDAAGAARVAAGAGPPGTAEAMAPFLGRLPALAPAQRAMAVHLGIFPSDGRVQVAANIDTTPDPGALALAGGPARPPAPAVEQTARRDERPGLRRQPRAGSPVERAAVTPPPERRQVAAAQPQPQRARPYLVPGPSGELRVRTRVARTEPTPAEQAPPSPPPARDITRFAPPPVEQETAPAEQPAASVVAAQSAPPAAAQSGPPATVVDPAVMAGVRPGDTIAAPGFSLTPSPPPPPPAAIPAPSERRNSALGDIAMVVNDLQDRQTATSTPPPPVSRAAPPPAAEGRHWVQVAGNLDREGMAGEFRRLRGRAPSLLNGMQAWTARTGATGRLLVGPFGSARDAQAFVNQLRPRGVEAVAWASAAGQNVERLLVPAGSERIARATPARRPEPATRGRTEQRAAAPSRTARAGNDDARTTRGRRETARSETQTRGARGRGEESRDTAGARGRTENARTNSSGRETRGSARAANARDTRAADTRGNRNAAANNRSNRNGSTVERRANDRDARPSRGRSAPEQRPASRRGRPD